MACFSRGKRSINRYAATECIVPHPQQDAYRYSSIVSECIGDLAPIPESLSAKTALDDTSRTPD
jgi:hypothetical protein